MSIEIDQWLSELLDCQSSDIRRRSVSGGDINQAEIVESAQGGRLFLKRNSQAALLKSEFDSLSLMRELGARNYPDVLAFTEIHGQALLALAYMELRPLISDTACLAGVILQRQHQIGHTHFGWPQDNFIGYTRQHNSWNSCWAAFFVDHRLAPQLELAAQRGLSAVHNKKIVSLCQNLSERIDLANIKPRLLHGDLWTGNVSGIKLAASDGDLKSGQQGAAFYDPAPYFGDPEVDIAMTELFGRLPDEFYRQYRSHHPEPYDFTERCACYNLYHALNHFNMFGPSYESLVGRFVDTLF